MADYRNTAAQKARKYGLNEQVFLRQIQQESGFNPKARSPAGARGIAQIMPATAKGWGVNPDDPDAALDAAARNMAKYVRDYKGDYKKALQAYNAGPGAVASGAADRYPETQKYVASILGGSAPKVSTKRAPVAKASSATGSDVDDALIDSLLSGKRKDLLRTAIELVDAGGGQSSSAAAPSAPSSKRAPMPKGGNSGIFELFWQGPGGINMKNGKVEPQGFVDGHTDHVHVAADPTTVLRYGKLAQSMGLHVGENSHFNGGKRVTSGHATNSYHYKDEAIDVSGDPKKMAEFAHRVARGGH